jgi:hypothetical protein
MKQWNATVLKRMLNAAGRLLKKITKKSATSLRTGKYWAWGLQWYVVEIFVPCTDFRTRANALDSSLAAPFAPLYKPYL